MESARLGWGQGLSMVRSLAVDRFGLMHSDLGADFHIRGSCAHQSGLSDARRVLRDVLLRGHFYDEV